MVFWTSLLQPGGQRGGSPPWRDGRPDPWLQPGRGGRPGGRSRRRSSKVAAIARVAGGGFVGWSWLSSLVSGLGFGVTTYVQGGCDLHADTSTCSKRVVYDKNMPSVWSGNRAPIQCNSHEFALHRHAGCALAQNNQITPNRSTCSQGTRCSPREPVFYRPRFDLSLSSSLDFETLSICLGPGTLTNENTALTVRDTKHVFHHLDPQVEAAAPGIAEVLFIRRIMTPASRLCSICRSGPLDRGVTHVLILRTM